MKAEKIDRKILVDGVLSQIVVERTFRLLPFELQEIYEKGKIQHKDFDIGLNLTLGFYIIEQLCRNEIKLLWWEYQSFKPNIIVV